MVLIMRVPLNVKKYDTENFTFFDVCTKKWKQYQTGTEFKYKNFDEFVADQQDEEESESDDQNENSYDKWQQWNKWSTNKKQGGNQYKTDFNFKQQQYKTSQESNTKSSSTRNVFRYLQILGLSSNVEQLSPHELKEAFHKHAKIWHPDRHASGKAKDDAEKRFKEGQEAYMILKKYADTLYSPV
eukprot:TRINITY_DN19186_c0_g1_i2.p1 TRINITY_DN19186_c0_g1~~TRINITY_DN19186_c0_g1_i2.p1  ORF type:complete len:185 (+),score=20.03 TRINITY_DN19186_c0_g1_i2:9-563(+)